MAATVSPVSFDLRLGPLRSANSPARPASVSRVSQRRTVAGFTANASATCSWVAALIRISDTAANRRAAQSRGIPGVGQIAVHENPAAVVVLNDRRGRADRARVIRHQRQGRLRGHHGHRPPLPTRTK